MAGGLMGLLLLGSESMAVAAGEIEPDRLVKQHISRFQVRAVDDDSTALALTSFTRFVNDIFVLFLYQRSKYENDDTAEQTDLFVGGPIGSASAMNPFGWVARSQHYSGLPTEYSLGLQLDIARHVPKEGYGDARDLVAPLLRRVTFVQVFALKSERDQTGYLDINFRYDIPLWGHVAIRGFGEHHLFEDANSYFQTYADLLYEAHKHVNVYYRYMYRSRDYSLSGPEGSESSIGIRFNYFF